MRHTAYLSLFLAMLFCSSLPAADIAPLISKCEGCHGPNGVSGHADLPSIGGQSEKYILASLRSYQKWGRPCVKSQFRYGDTSRPESNMCEVTESLSEDEFLALAAHFSSLPFVPARQPFDTDLAARGAELHAANCETCHMKGGSDTDSLGPRLAGQWSQYLRAAIKFVPTGEHLVPRLMENKIIELDADEWDALLNYYASQQEEAQ